MKFIKKRLEALAHSANLGKRPTLPQQSLPLQTPNMVSVLSPSGFGEAEEKPATPVQKLNERKALERSKHENLIRQATIQSVKEGDAARRRNNSRIFAASKDNILCSDGSVSGSGSGSSDTALNTSAFADVPYGAVKPPSPPVHIHNKSQGKQNITKIVKFSPKMFIGFGCEFRFLRKYGFSSTSS